MRFAKAVMAVAASSMAIVPAMANPAASLSVSNAKSVRAATSAGKSNEAAGGSFLLPGLAIAAIITGVVIAVSDGDSDS